jgi:hypothetical protein
VLAAAGSAALAVALAVALPMAPARAQIEAPDLAVSITAARHILPADGWSAVETVVRNDGLAPAEGVRVTITMPPELPPMGYTTSSSWDCTWRSPVTECTLAGVLAPDTETAVIRHNVTVADAVPPASLRVTASVSTTSYETPAENNAAWCDLDVVESGVIQGQIWHDLDGDGVRQPTEPTIPEVGVSINSLDDEDGYGSSNTIDGTYQERVPVKRYQISVDILSYRWRFTTPDAGDDDSLDSDVVPVRETAFQQYAESPVLVVRADEPVTVDVGLVAVDAG